jgi:hypothetical protein
MLIYIQGYNPKPCKFTVHYSSQLIGDKLISIIAIYTKSHMASDTPKDDGIISHPKHSDLKNTWSKD